MKTKRTTNVKAASATGSANRKQAIATAPASFVEEIRQYMKRFDITKQAMARILQMDVSNFSKIITGNSDRSMPATKVLLFREYLNELVRVKERIGPMATKQLATQTVNAHLAPTPANDLNKMVPAAFMDYAHGMEREIKFYRDTIVPNLNMLISKVSDMQQQMAHLQMRLQGGAWKQMEDDCPLHEPLELLRGEPGNS